MKTDPIRAAERSTIKAAVKASTETSSAMNQTARIHPRINRDDTRVPMRIN